MSLKLLSSILFVALAACGGAAAAVVPEGASSATPAPEVVKPRMPEPVEQVAVPTGKDCATATADCDNGLCHITVKNDCAEPVTCNVAIAAVCKSATDTGEARARGRDTIAAKTTSKISVGASCQGGSVLTSAVKEMQCK